MSNLYSITTNKAAIAARLRVINQYAGNLPPMPPIFWDDPVPALRSDNGFRELVMMGCPTRSRARYRSFLEFSATLVPPKAIQI